MPLVNEHMLSDIEFQQLEVVHMLIKVKPLSRPDHGSIPPNLLRNGGNDMVTLLLSFFKI